MAGCATVSYFNGRRVTDCNPPICLALGNASILEDATVTDWGPRQESELQEIL